MLLCLLNRLPLADQSANPDLLVALERKEHAVLSESDFEIVREISQVVPSCHLRLQEWSSYAACRILVEPFAILVRSLH